MGRRRNESEAEKTFRPVDDASGIRAGDRLLIPCEGGPGISRLEVFPPRLELAEHGGTYVLDNDGPISSWRYQFVERR